MLCKLRCRPRRPRSPLLWFLGDPRRRPETGWAPRGSPVLFAVHQSYILFNSFCNGQYSRAVHVREAKILMSSENIHYLPLMLSNKSFINTRKNKSPKLDPTIRYSRSSMINILFVTIICYILQFI